jgi:hypothetical protein
MQANPSTSKGDSDDTPIFIDVEMHWLEAHWKTEYDFLQHHQLDGRKKEDRVRGRRILRGWFREEVLNPSGAKKTSKTKYSASLPYTTTEREWLDAHWYNESLFLDSYGLDACKENDREEGRRILRALLVQEKKRIEDNEKIAEVQEFFDTVPYYDHEREWLRTQWGGEVEFLRAHNLDYSKPGDEYRGRWLVRMLLRMEEEENKEDEEMRQAQTGA